MIGLTSPVITMGYPVQKREPRTKPSDKRPAVSKRTQFVRSIIREVSGYAPYEKRLMELLKNSMDKRAKKLAKKRLGTMRRAKAKIEELSQIIAESRRQH